MSYQLTLHAKRAYLHAVVTGENTRENVAGYLQDLFAIVMTEASRAVGVFEAIAFVDLNAGGDMMKFAENVALGHGIPVRLFGTLAEADKWLENPWPR